jgi:hypothetical protein
MSVRICKTCKEEKPLDEFHSSVSSTFISESDKVYRRRVCKKCHTKTNGERRKAVVAWFAEYKKTLKCQHCQVADFRVLEFHHEDSSTKEFNLGDLVRKTPSKERLMTEVDKCIVLCANCHRIHHYKERNLKLLETL